MPSPEYEAFLACLTEDLVSAEDSLEVARDKLEAMHGHPIDDGTSVEWVELCGVRCAWIDTEESRSPDGASRVMVLHHGGAFIAACGDGYLFYAEMLARALEARVLMIDYRLAPAHRFPAQLDDCTAAYRGLLETGVAASRVGFIGDSCGGGLALSSLLRLRTEGADMPALAVTLGGWFDLEATGASATSPVAHDPFANAAFTRARGRDYVGPDGAPAHPLVSPVHADMTGLPPLLLQVGQIDLTRDDAVRVCERAGRAGVDVTLEVWPEMVHGFQGLAAAAIPEGVEALGHVGEYVRARIP